MATASGVPANLTPVTTRAELRQERFRAMLARWMPQLVALTGLPRERLESEDLRTVAAPFFKPAGVHIRCGDGSNMHFLSAFALQDPARPGRVAIFSRNAGSLELDLAPEDVLDLDPTESSAD